MIAKKKRKKLEIQDLDIPFYLDEEIRTRLIKKAIEQGISPRDLLHNILKKELK